MCGGQSWGEGTKQENEESENFVIRSKEGKGITKA